MHGSWMRRSVTRNVAPHRGAMNHSDWSWMRGQTWQPLAFESGSWIFAPSQLQHRTFSVSILQRRVALYPSRSLSGEV